MYYLCSENKGAVQLRGYREVTTKLICMFVFAYAKSRFSHNAAHMICSKAGVQFSFHFIEVFQTGAPPGWSRRMLGRNISVSLYHVTNYSFASYNFLLCNSLKKSFMITDLCVFQEPLEEKFQNISDTAMRFMKVSGVLLMLQTNLL